MQKVGRVDALLSWLDSQLYRSPVLLECWQAIAKVFCLPGSFTSSWFSDDLSRGLAVYCRRYRPCSLSSAARARSIGLMRMTGKIADGSTETDKH